MSSVTSEVARSDAVVTHQLPTVLEFMQMLWAVVHGMETTSKRMAAELGVTGPQRMVLRVVGLHPGVSAGTVAAILHVHPSTMTGVLQRLVTRGLILRATACGDRRRAVLRLTPRGRKVNEAGRGTVEAATDTALEGISNRDMMITRNVLLRVSGHLAEPFRSRSAARRSSSNRRTQFG